MAQLKQHNHQETESLFPLATRFRIVELGRVDAQRWTDDLAILKELITANQAMYPSIDRWFARKVVPGLRSSERIAYVAYEDDNPIASAVLKLGDRSKFCHVRIHRSFQDMDLGQMFFTQMALEARHRAKEIHFTLPESLWSEKAGFFGSFGFSDPRKAFRQYRHGDPELSCSASLTTVLSNLLEKLPRLVTKFSVGGYSLNNKILISVKPQYAESILAGAKLVEIRRRFSDRWVGCRAVLYASQPLGALVGEATVASVTRGRPADIWANFGPQIGCSWDDFEAYVASANEVSAIELRDVIPYQSPVSVAQVSHLLNTHLRPPQSFCDLKLDDDNPWAQAVSVASLLHGRFSYIKRHP
jgi:predicted transcriptional regulator